MVGIPGLEPGNPEGADLQSAAVAAVPYPHKISLATTDFLMNPTQQVGARNYTLQLPQFVRGFLYTV